MKLAAPAVPHPLAHEPAEWVPIASLKPWPSNPRKGQPVDEVARLIVRFGWGNPILARRDGRMVVAGHTRIKAAKKLASMWAAASPDARTTWHAEAVRVATEKVVLVRFGDWSEHDARVLAVADNKISELAEWDSEMVAEALADFTAEDFAIAAWENGEGGFVVDEDHEGFDGLPSGDREPFQQSTFTLHDDQVAVVEAAIGLASKDSRIDKTKNANRRGSALALICEVYVERG